MAVTGTSYFANAIVGQPQVGADFDIHEVHLDTPRYAVGLGFERSDGNRYRYVHYGLATAVGQLVSQDRSESSISGANLVINPTSAGKPDFEPVNMGAVGSHFVEATITLTAGQMAGGTMHIVGGTGSGYTYRIRGNTAPDSTRSGASRIQTYEPIKVALDQTADINLVGCKYANLEPATTGTVIGADNVLAGFCQSAATKDDFGWICTAGITTVVAATNLTGGAGIVVGGIAGTVEASEQSFHTSDTNVTLREVIGTAIDTQAVASSWSAAVVRFE